MKLVGITDLFIPRQYIEDGFKILEPLGVEIVILDWKLKGFDEFQSINLLIEQKGCEAYEIPEYIFENVKDADIIITEFCPVSKKMIDICKKLKVIGIMRAGYENINLDYANEKGILVFNTVGRNADAVADFTIGLMISECRNIARGHCGLKKGIWIKEYSNSSYVPDLTGKTVGIIGLGEIGRKVAKRLIGFDTRLIAFDPFIHCADYGVELVSLEYLMKASDFITIHTRLTSETKHMINEKYLSMMKTTAYFINTSRAGIVDEKALYKVLKNKNIAGAAMDVFEKEPPGKYYPIVTLENVTITPHLAGGTTDSFRNSPKKLAKEIKKLWEKKESTMIVNKQLFRKIIVSSQYPFFKQL
jgi:D-3-phosphoglycerate dehydrogenase